MSRGRLFLIALIAGGLAGLGHAPFSLWPVALLGFAAMAWAVAGAGGPARAALAGWSGGVGYFLVTLNWIVDPFFVDPARDGWMAPFALVFLTGGLALFWGLAGWVSAQMAGPKVLTWAVALAAVEMGRGYVLTGFPWALPAYVWTETPVRVTAGWIGPYGLSLLTLVACSLPVARRRWTGSALAAALIAALFALGWAGSDRKVGSDGIVRLVQPNAPQDQKWDPDKAMVFFDRQLADTAAPKTGGVAEIVWPESAVPWLLDYAAPALERIADAAEGVPVILGLNREAGGRYYNAMVTVGPGGEPGEVYDKVHLVPFGEYIPFGGLARLIGLQSFAAREGYGFSAGQRVHLIDTPLGKALPLICYEAIFPQGMFAAGERPDYLLQITNDAWFGTFSGPFQHLQQARFRAAEQGLPLVRVANTGVSAVIDYTGQVTAMLPMGKAAYLDADLPSGRRVTLYSRTGDGPVAALLAAFWAVLLALGARNTIAKRGRLS